MTGSTDPAREVHLRADGLRIRANALDSMIVRMRVNRPVMQRRGHFFSRGDRDADVEVHLTAQEDRMFYEWACEKRNEYEAEARRLDATVKVVEP